MGWVIRDPRIIWWGGRGGFLDPRGSVIRGPPTTQGRISALQILYENFVRNLFGVLKDLCRDTLGIAFAT